MFTHWQGLDMLLAGLVLLTSVGIFLFYLQAACQKVLRREFENDYFESVVDANRLEFPSVRNIAERAEVTGDFGGMKTALKCDYMALTFLLKHASNASLRFTTEDRLLMIYFHLNFLSLKLCHLLGLRENPAILKLTAILQYFSNVIGQRVCELRFASVWPQINCQASGPPSIEACLRPR